MDYVFVLFPTLRKFFIYLSFSVRYGKKCFFSIVGKSFVRLTFILYSFMLLVRNSLIFQKLFSEHMPHLINLFILFILDD